MKKLLMPALLLSLVVILSGCGNKQADTTVEEKEPVVQETVVEESTVENTTETPAAQ